MSFYNFNIPTSERFFWFNKNYFSIFGVRTSDQNKMVMMILQWHATTMMMTTNIIITIDSNKPPNVTKQSQHTVWSTINMNEKAARFKNTDVSQNDSEWQQQAAAVAAAPVYHHVDCFIRRCYNKRHFVIIIDVSAYTVFDCCLNIGNWKEDGYLSAFSPLSLLLLMLAVAILRWYSCLLR